MGIEGERDGEGEFEQPDTNKVEHPERERTGAGRNLGKARERERDKRAQPIEQTCLGPRAHVRVTPGPEGRVWDKPSIGSLRVVGSSIVCGLGCVW